MEIAPYQFSPEKQRIRKWWLWLTFSIGGISSIISILSDAAQVEWIKQSATIMLMSPAERKLVAIFVSFLGNSLWIGMNYHCVYKKYGTKFLTFQLIFFPISLCIGAIDFFLFYTQVKTAGLIALLTTHFSIVCIWYSYSLKARRMNKNLVAVLSDKDLALTQSLQPSEKPQPIS